MVKTRPTIGLALGSGSARGWSHIGVIRALEALGVEIDIIAGCSIGAFVGAAYASQQFDPLEQWVRNLTWKDIVRLLDFTLIGGGFVQGEKLFQFIHMQTHTADIEHLPKKFGCVATALNSGNEIWFQSGSLSAAVRASIALPGLLTPSKVNNQWFVDGGLTNPVPVSLCRAMGADIVIAVNLNGDIVGKHNHSPDTTMPSPRSEEAFLSRLTHQLKASFYEHKELLLKQLLGTEDNTPSLFEVLSTSINIMQQQITQSRLKDDPPDILLEPQLAHLALMEFDQADQAITEGLHCVQAKQTQIQNLIRNWRA